MGKLDELLRSVSAAAPASRYIPGAGAALPGMDLADASDVLRRAVVRWKGSPTEIVLHAQDALAGAPVPSSASGLRGRAFASALLDAVDEQSELAPMLYRGDALPPSRNPSPLVGWTSNPQVAKGWAGHYGGDVHNLEGARGLRLAGIVGDMFDDGEAEWIVRNALAPMRASPQGGLQVLPLTR